VKTETSVSEPRSSDLPTGGPKQDLVLRSGYAVEAGESDGNEVLRLRAPDGRIFLKIALTPSGPEVELSSVNLSIAADGDVRVACDRFQVEARREVTLCSEGDLRSRAGGAIESEAFEQRHRALRGNIELRANDDVALDGERVRLNTAKPLAPAQGITRTGLLRAPPEGSR
jgi:hypothetical protein